LTRRAVARPGGGRGRVAVMARRNIVDGLPSMSWAAGRGAYSSKGHESLAPFVGGAASLGAAAGSLSIHGLSRGAGVQVPSGEEAMGPGRGGPSAPSRKGREENVAAPIHDRGFPATGRSQLQFTMAEAGRASVLCWAKDDVGSSVVRGSDGRGVLVGHMGRLARRWTTRRRGNLPRRGHDERATMTARSGSVRVGCMAVNQIPCVQGDEERGARLSPSFFTLKLFAIRAGGPNP
jgi:hypothetical protein